MVEDWVQANIDNYRYTGNQKEIHFDCIFCSDTRQRMYVNIDSGKVHCHNCNYGGTIINLIQFVEGISWSQAMYRYKDIKGSQKLPQKVSEEIQQRMIMGQYRVDTDKRAIPLPEEYQLLSGSSNIVAKRAIKYLHSRKISDKQIEQHKFGFCVSGEYENRIIIPITEYGELKFWVARAIGNVSFMKEKSPSDEEYQISKSEVIFNIDRAAQEYHSIVISEGIFDALSWGDIGVSLLGKSLYDEQFNILLDYRELLTDGVYIAVDWDARSNATKIAERLSDYFDVKIINIPKKFDDPNKYLQKHNKKAMWKLIHDAEPYTKFSGIRRRLLG